VLTSLRSIRRSKTRSVALCLATFLALATIAFAQTPERAELLAEPKLDEEAIKLFLAAGYPIDFAVDDGRTALTSAVMYRHLDVALFLVKAGADVNIADSNNATPLFHAAGNCEATELVRALIDAGADPSPATRGSTTAIQMAEMMKCEENAKLIRSASN